MSFKYKINISYNGQKFQGWQDQGSKISTVQKTIEKMLSKYLGTPTKIHGCSRTDKGVSALEYIASFKSSKKINQDNFLLMMRHKDICFKNITLVSNDFNPQKNFRKKYHYLVGDLCAPKQQANQHVYNVPYPIHINDKIIKAWADLFKGKSNYKSLSSSGSRKPHYIRTVEVNIKDLSTKHYQLYQIEFESSGFLKYMIRHIVGSLLLVLKNDISLKDIAQSLQDGSSIKNYKAPAIGLTLFDVKYSQESP